MSGGKAKNDNEPLFCFDWCLGWAASQYYNHMQCIQSMLNDIDWVRSPIKYTYIVASLTGALVKCKSNDKESFGDYFSRPRQYTSSVLAPIQLRVVVGVVAYSKIFRQECFHWYTAYSNFSWARKIRPRQCIPNSPYFSVSVETQGQIRQIFLRIRKYLGQWK